MTQLFFNSSGKLKKKRSPLSPLLKVLGTLSLGTTIGFIIWSWTHVIKEFNGIDSNLSPIVFKRKISYFKNYTTESMNHIYESQLKIIPQVFADRKQHAENTCKLINELKQENNATNSTTTRTTSYFGIRNIKVRTGSSFYINSRRNWIFINYKINGNGSIPPNSFTIEWCPVYKAASSPWMAVLGKLSNIVTQHTEDEIRKGKLTFIKLFKDLRLNIPTSRNILKENNGKSYKILIVRHPFERLLSAYRDKLERIQGREFYYKKYGYEIISRFRYSNQFQDMVTNKGKNIDTFHAMLSKILELRNLVGMSGGNQKIRPTFAEFVEYLLSTDPRSMDEHWRPIYIDCNPCQYSFDLILKVETMDVDRDELFNLLGLKNGGGVVVEELEKIWRRWSNKTIPKNIFNNTTTTTDTKNINSTKASTTHRQNDIFLHYFSQIKKSNLKLLYKMYEPDFLLFNYTPTTFYSMGK